MIEKVASNLGRNDEGPNIELARKLVETGDTEGIAEIVEGLGNPDKNIRSDCIKVLYEIAVQNPELVAGYAGIFIRLLSSRNNRLVWGAMTVLASIVGYNPDEIFNHLDEIKKAYDAGSVITVDNCISVFAGLSRTSAEYERTVFPLIVRHLETCRPKEVGQHAERAFVCVNKNNSSDFREALLKKISSLTEPQRKRVNKLLKLIDEERYWAID